MQTDKCAVMPANSYATALDGECEIHRADVGSPMA